MPVNIIHEKGKMTAEISGELDHHEAAEIRTAVDGELAQSFPELLNFDMSGVTFMDSSGVGLVLGRLRTVKQWDGKVRITDPSPRAEKILKLSGLSALIVKSRAAGKKAEK